MTTYYLDKLYPLQDQVLKIIGSELKGFELYLTGGTCLSRGYFNHRYSDDLDLFHHDPTTGKKQIQALIDILTRQFDLVTTINSEDLISIKIDSILKVDFVRDVGKHWGSFVPHPIYPLLDNLNNILANKIGAIMDRDEAKDVVDFWIIAKSKTPDWPTIFTGANTKAAGLLPPLVAKRLDEFPVDWLSRIEWIIPPPEPTAFKQDLDQIIDQMLAV